MSCIITREPVYEDPPDSPSVVLGTTESPMDVVCVIDLDTASPGTADGGGTPHPCLTWAVTVRDANLTQPLEAVIYLNRQGDLPASATAIGNPDVPAMGERSRRVPFTLDATQLRMGCNRLEVQVAESFSPFPDFAAPEGAEVAVGYWWIAARRGAMSVDMRGCQTRGDDGL